MCSARRLVRKRQRNKRQENRNNKAFCSVRGAFLCYGVTDGGKRMAKWMVSAKKADFYRIAERFHIDPVIARIIRNRDVLGEEEIDRFLHGTLRDMHDPFRLKDADKAAAILRDKIAAGK